MQESPTHRLPQETQSLAISQYVAAVMMFWTLAVGVSLWFNIDSAYLHAEDSAHVQAVTVFEQEQAYRRWNASLGDMYVTVTEATPPNPYLAHDPQRDLAATGGVGLTKIASAHMSRLVHELPSAGRVRARLTSQNPLRPENAPDAWEADALARLHDLPAGAPQEVFAVREVGGEPYLRLMRPLVVDASCLPCHADQGYTTGMQRGGVSVTVPMAPFFSAASRTVDILCLSHGVMWLLGVFGCLLGARRLGRHIRERDVAERNLQRLTGELESRVEERTRDLHERQQELQAFMDHTDAGVYLKNMRHEYVLVNRRMAELLGRAPEELTGHTSQAFVDPELADRVRACERQVMDEGRSVLAGDIVFTGQDDRVFSAHVFPVLDLNSRERRGVGCILVDITERKRLEEELRASKEAAERASRAKSDFLANISHEIRTPLNGVIGMADLLLRGRLDPDQSSMVAVIKTSGDSLLHVLNDLLDFSKIEAGKMLIDPQPFSLRDMVFDAMKGLAPVAYKKKLEMIVHIAPKVPDRLLGDGPRIRQILLNLAGNAIKFTERGDVSLVVRLLEQTDDAITLRFSVTDTGVGIDPVAQERIFAAFEQGDSSTTRRYGGTGLGLTISYRLAELMDSRLCVKSQPGYGSTFWFDVRLGMLRDAAPKRALVSVRELKDTPVLVVDDNPTNRRIFLEQLTAWGLRAEESASVDEALRLLHVASHSFSPFALVLTDLQMPEKDGVALARAIRADEGLHHLPVLLLSSGDLPDDATARLFQGHLSKPVRPDELLGAMAAALDVWESVHVEQLHTRSEADEAAARERMPHLRVLLAEDMEMNQLVATRMLRDLGHEVVTVNDGLHAVEIALRENIDVVLMDIQMPVMDGVQAVQRIREDEAARADGSHLPIAAMTAHALKGDRQKYLDAGMDAYIAKPLLLDALARLFEDLVARFSLRSRVARVPVDDGFDAPVAVQAQGGEAASASGNTVGHELAGEPGAFSVAAGEGDDPFDADMLRQSFSGDTALARQGMGIYLRDAPGLLRGIEDALAANDRAGLIEHAHALKGIAAYYTRRGVYALCRTLEDAARENTPEGARTVVETLPLLREACARLAGAMQAYINK